MTRQWLGTSVRQPWFVRPNRYGTARVYRGYRVRPIAPRRVGSDHGVYTYNIIIVLLLQYHVRVCRKRARKTSATGKTASLRQYPCLKYLLIYYAVIPIMYVVIFLWYLFVQGNYINNSKKNHTININLTAVDSSCHRAFFCSPPRLCSCTLRQRPCV